MKSHRLCGNMEVMRNIATYYVKLQTIGAKYRTLRSPGLAGVRDGAITAHLQPNDSILRLRLKPQTPAS